MSLLSWIAAQQGSVDPINEATLIRAIIDHLLERGKFDTLLRGAFDPEFKEILLSELAYYMKARTEPATYNEVLTFFIEFFAKRNLNFEADRILRALLNCRILDVAEGRVFFRLHCYQDYFVARYLRDNASALEAVRTREEHTDWARELDILTSLTRKDFGLLEEIQRILDRLASEMALSSEMPGFSTYQLNRVLSPPNLRKLRNSKPTQDVIDDIQDNAEARALERKTSDGQQQSEEAVKSSHRYYALLSLLGKVIRNAEAADGSIKESASRTFVRNQQQLISLVAKAVGDQEPKIREVLLAAGEKDSAVADLVLYFVRILLPVALLKLAVREIGTIKLIETFKKNLVDLPSDDEARILYGLLAFDISSQAGLELLAPIVQATSNATIIRIIQIKVILAYLMNDYDPSQQAELERLIYEIEQRLGTAPVPLQTLKVRVAAQTISHVEGD